VPERWIVAQTFAALGRNRRLGKDYERKVQTSEALIGVTIIRLQGPQPYYFLPQSHGEYIIIE
jgi:hypothetical protein